MSKTSKLDLQKELKHLYAPSAKTIELVDVPRFRYAMVDGQLEPGQAPETSLAFQDAMQALYGISFTLKFMSKLRKSNPVDYKVMALEGLWWTDARGFSFDKSEPWQFTLMIMQPEHITRKMYQEALQKLQDKKDNPALSRLRFEGFHEGLCIQTMHVGPYDQEPATIARMKSFAEESELLFRGKHHEIYLGDPRRCKPERLKTVLRQPVQKRQL
jgi:hypothetical protein